MSPVSSERLRNYAVFPDGSAAWEPALEVGESPDPAAQAALAEDGSTSLPAVATPVSTVHCVHSFQQGWAVAAAAIALAVCSAVSGVLATRWAEAIAAPPIADTPCIRTDSRPAADPQTLSSPSP